MSPKNNNKELLGKGIRSLLQNINDDLKTTTGELKKEVVEKATTSTRLVTIKVKIKVKIRKIKANPNYFPILKQKWNHTN